MKKKFTLFQIRSLLTPALFISGIMILFAIIYGSTANIYTTYHVNVYGNPEYIMTSASTGLIGFNVTSVVCAICMGITISIYRFSLKKADIYYQSPYKENTTRVIRTFIGMVYLAVAFTISFILLVSIYCTRLGGKINYFNEDFYYEIANLRFLGYLWMYFIGLMAVICSYLSIVAITSTCNSLVNTIIVTIEFILFSALLIPTIQKALDAFDFINAYKFFDDIYISPFDIANLLFPDAEKFTVGIRNVSLDKGFIKILVDNILLVVLTPLLLIPIFLKKEPSGELCGKGGFNNNSGYFIHHITAGVLLTFMASEEIFPAFSILEYLLSLLAYFLITVWINKSFKLKQKDIIPMIVNSSMGLSLWITFIVYNSMK